MAMCVDRRAEIGGDLYGGLEIKSIDQVFCSKQEGAVLL